jgi:hypothetical protein
LIAVYFLITAIAKPRIAVSVEDLQHVRNAVVRFCDAPNAVPYLASLGNEVIIAIDHGKRSDLLSYVIVAMVFSRAMRSWYWPGRGSEQAAFCAIPKELLAATNCAAI